MTGRNAWIAHRFVGNIALFGVGVVAAGAAWWAIILLFFVFELINGMFFTPKWRDQIHVMWRDGSETLFAYNEQQGVEVKAHTRKELGK